MNIKSLLLGSAAALIAVSGARAADAVTVAEPEPAEYVKICDVYGAGYFYIPGTETCLRIGGYVRYDIGVGDIGGVQNAFDHGRPVRGNPRDGDSYGKNARFTLRTWTAQETELGTLKTFTETRTNFGNGNRHPDGTGITRNPSPSNPSDDWEAGNRGTTLNFAWVQLGGLRVGKDESAFDTFTGYAGNVIQDTLVGYGSFDTNVVQYYFDAGNGFSAVASLEEGSGKDTIDSYVPHVVAGVKYTQGWGSVVGALAYDSNYQALTGKVRLDVKATNELSLFIMGGWGQDGSGKVDSTNSNFYKVWDGNWAVWGGGTYKFNEKTSFNTQISYDEGKTLGVAANIAYDIVPGFTITAEADYMNQKSNVYHSVGGDSWGGTLRFQRSF
jgi:hypothetical protein